MIRAPMPALLLLTRTRWALAPLLLALLFAASGLTAPSGALRTGAVGTVHAHEIEGVEEAIDVGVSDAAGAPQPTSTPVPTASPLLSIADAAAAVAPSVVQVLTPDGAGTGVRVSRGIITNAHVVQGAASVQVRTRDGASAPAFVARLDEGSDLALLLTEMVLPPVALQDALSQRQGDEVLVLGYPRPFSLGLAGGQATLTRGLLSAVRRDTGGVLLVQTDAAINPGNSGGAIFNLRGQLLGIVSFKLKESEGLGFGIAAETVQAFLDGQSFAGPTPITPTPSPTPSGPSIFRGNPRDLALRPEEVGPGFLKIAAESSGPIYSVQYGSPVLRVVSWVAVYSGVAEAQAAWPDLAGLGGPEEPMVGNLFLGDAGVLKRRTDGKLSRAVVRVANVIAWVGIEGRGGQLAPSPEVAADYLRFVAGRAFSGPK